MRNIPGYTQGEPEYIGKMPIRKDIEVIPERKIEWYKREIGYWWWRLFNLIPSIHRKNMEAIDQWEKERQEHENEELERRKKVWAEGKGTYMLPLDIHFNNPHPVPRRGNLHWNVGKLEFVMVNATGLTKIKLEDDDGKEKD